MTLLAGAPTLADDVTAAMVAATAIKIAKTSNTARSSTTTLAADPVLLVPVLANRIYRMEAFLLVTSGITPDFKFDFTGPAGSAHAFNTITLARSAAQGSTTPIDVRYGEDGLAVAPPSPAGATYATQRLQLHVVGTLDTAGTAGNFTFRWSQNTSDAGATTVYAGSWLRLEEMG